MYFALNKKSDGLESYVSFLFDILETNNQVYKNIFKEILEEAKLLRTSKNIYAINRYRFGIITFLSEQESLVSSIDPNNMEKRDFENILRCIETEVCIEI
jgi:hypothetical protein